MRILNEEISRLANELARCGLDVGGLREEQRRKERGVVGEVISAVALAGQIAREFTVSDKGLDMEIEFNDDAGNATG